MFLTSSLVDTPFPLLLFLHLQYALIPQLTLARSQSNEHVLCHDLPRHLAHLMELLEQHVVHGLPVPVCTLLHAVLDLLKRLPYRRSAGLGQQEAYTISLQGAQWHLVDDVGLAVVERGVVGGGWDIGKYWGAGTDAA
jgi:hypothetical protein